MCKSCFVLLLAWDPRIIYYLVILTYSEFRKEINTLEIMVGLALSGSKI